MKPSIRISIPKPCTEDWDKMTEADKGRHCLSCNKIVADLTGMSNEEILAFVQGREGKVCGRMKAEQVSGSGGIFHGQFGFFTQRFLAAVMIAFGSFLFSLDAEAKTMLEKTRMEWVGDSAGQLHKDSAFVRGMVTDKETKEPITFATIQIFLNDVEVGRGQAGVDGKYKISVPVTSGAKVKVVATAIGYEYYSSGDVALTKSKTSVVNIKMQEEKYHLMGDIDINYDGH